MTKKLSEREIFEIVEYSLIHHDISPRKSIGIDLKKIETHELNNYKVAVAYIIESEFFKANINLTYDFIVDVMYKVSSIYKKTNNWSNEFPEVSYYYDAVRIILDKELENTSKNSETTNDSEWNENHS